MHSTNSSKLFHLREECGKKLLKAVTSLPFVSPFSDHSTVTLLVWMLMLLTTAAWILPEK